MNDRIQENIYFEAKRMINELIPYRELDYSNGIVANIIALGKKDKLNTDWIRNKLLSDVEDGFLTYGQAVAINNKYIEAVNKVKAMF